MPATAGGEAMADEEQVKRLNQGILEWNEWRQNNPTIRPDLSQANLSEADLSDANLREANLLGADLRGAYLTGAALYGANLYGADLESANLIEARLLATIFGNVDLASVIGLETCIHGAASVIDHRTLEKSKSRPLPLAFLRGVGLPDNLIEYLPSLFNQPIQHYSCFISYSAKDQEFAERLHADLQNKGVRCWFAPHDMPIGGKIRDEIDTAIRLRDKLLLILSEHSIRSNWVEDEIEQAFEEEQKRDQVVLFPVRLDEEVKTTGKAWASKLRRARHIGDFTRWKDHDAYVRSFERVLRDLTKPQAQ
jgi:TIR domain/Pentapeptide repeats (8 copies)